MAKARATVVGALAAMLVVAPLAWAQPPTPPVASRGEPGAAHQALAPLIGRFRVAKTSWFPGIASNGPVSCADLVATREWIGDGRFVREVTQGTMGGKPYFRMGLLGYSTMDQRYEWVTVDAFNANMMIYQGAAGSGPVQPIEVSGSFTDQGLMGEGFVGRPIAQRTEIQIDGLRGATIRLYVTAPEQQELLADEMVYERIDDGR